MPQLFSRMDDMNWLTPSIADILDQGPPPPGGDGTIREQMLILQNELASYETPIRILNVRPSPSHILFVLQPDMVGRLVNRRSVTSDELRRSIARLADNHREWRVGFLPTLSDVTDASGILLRTEQHRPLSLRRLIVRNTFRDHPSTFAFTPGNTLEGQVIVWDLLQTNHILVIGDSTGRRHLVSGILLTLMLLNTPTELRFIISGDASASYKTIANSPHALGRQLNNPDEIVRLIDGMTQEMQRRLDLFYQAGQDEIGGYNAAQQDQNRQILPRIVIVIDTLSSEGLGDKIANLAPEIRDLVLNGPEVGIHLIVTVNDASELPEGLGQLINQQIVMRSAAPELGDLVTNFHSSLNRFVDAFTLERNESGQIVTPVELYAVTDSEIERAVAYWQQMNGKRQRETSAEVRTVTNTEQGVTAMLSPVTMQPADTTTRPVIQQARMLAAYLGWLSTGALSDILSASPDEARAIMTQLQAEGVLESGDGAMLRFIKLADNPLR